MLCVPFLGHMSYLMSTLVPLSGIIFKRKSSPFQMEYEKIHFAEWKGLFGLICSANFLMIAEQWTQTITVSASISSSTLYARKSFIIAWVCRLSFAWDTNYVGSGTKLLARWSRYDQTITSI